MTTMKAKSVTNNKAFLIIVLFFMIVVSFFLLNISKDVSSTKLLIQSNAQEVDGSESAISDNWCGLPCNYACDPAFGAKCGTGLQCTQTVHGPRCRNPQAPERADCGSNGTRECAELCDPAKQLDCKTGLICVDDPSGRSVCVHPNDPTNYTCSSSQSTPEPCPSGCVVQFGACTCGGSVEVTPTPTPAPCPPECRIEFGACVCG